jgi:hypothetical protein
MTDSAGAALRAELQEDTIARPGEVEIQSELRRGCRNLTRVDVGVAVRHGEAPVTEKVHHVSRRNARFMEERRVGGAERVRCDAHAHLSAQEVKEGSNCPESEGTIAKDGRQELGMRALCLRALSKISTDNLTQLRRHEGTARPPAKRSLSSFDEDAPGRKINIRKAERKGLTATKTCEHEQSKETQVTRPLKLTTPWVVLDPSQHILGAFAGEIPWQREPGTRRAKEPKRVDAAATARESVEQRGQRVPIGAARSSQSVFGAEPSDPDLKDPNLLVDVARKEPIREVLRGEKRTERVGGDPPPRHGGRRQFFNSERVVAG